LGCEGPFCPSPRPYGNRGVGGDIKRGRKNAPQKNSLKKLPPHVGVAQVIFPREKNSHNARGCQDLTERDVICFPQKRLGNRVELTQRGGGGGKLVSERLGKAKNRITQKTTGFKKRIGGKSPRFARWGGGAKPCWI